MFRRFTPRASISFKPAPDHLLYASYSEGFKGGGFDPRGSGIAAPDLNGNGVSGAGGDYADVYDFLSFDPESVTPSEIGWQRTEASRLGNECIRTVESRWTTYHSKK